MSYSHYRAVVLWRCWVRRLQVCIHIGALVQALLYDLLSFATSACNERTKAAQFAVAPPLRLRLVLQPIHLSVVVTRLVKTLCISGTQVRDSTVAGAQHDEFETHTA